MLLILREVKHDSKKYFIIFLIAKIINYDYNKYYIIKIKLSYQLLLKLIYCNSFTVYYI
jgi:hypothetical protein